MNTQEAADLFAFTKEVYNPFKSLMTVSLSYRNQSIDLQSKSMDWFLYDMKLRHQRVKVNVIFLYP